MNLSRIDKVTNGFAILIALVGITLSVTYLHDSREESKLAKQQIIEKLYPLDPVDLEEFSLKIKKLVDLIDLCYVELLADMPLSDTEYCKKYDEYVKKFHQSYVMLTTEQLSSWTASDEVTKAMAEILLGRLEHLSNKQKDVMKQIYYNGN